MIFYILSFLIFCVICYYVYLDLHRDNSRFEVGEQKKRNKRDKKLSDLIGEKGFIQEDWDEDLLDIFIEEGL